MSSSVLELAQYLGVAAGYHRIDGSYWSCSEETALACLQAMGLAVESEATAAQILVRLRQEHDSRDLPEEVLATAGEPLEGVWPAGRISFEGGGRLTFPGGAMPALPVGVHHYETEACTALLIVSPRAAPGVQQLTGKARAWGYSAALYGLSSSSNLGVGDFADLAHAATALAATGAAFLGINPVHFQGLDDRSESPYSPSSRSALDVRHIALHKVPEVQCSESARLLLDEARAAIDTQASRLHADYEQRQRWLAPVLRAAFDTGLPQLPARLAAFQQWSQAQSMLLRRQALYEALTATYGLDWRCWPESLQDPESSAVIELEAAVAPLVQFHLWCQWLAEQQLGAAQHAAKSAGMPLGLYLDIAVGVRPGGAETWAGRSAFAVGVSLGAPPDALSSTGQIWGLAPFSPLGLRRAAYEPMRAMLRQTMAHAGVVRIDHVIGFARSFWVPEGGLPGAYVHFPLEAMLAVLRIEAQRAGCLVIGEDLGTVPDGLRERLAAASVLGCAIMPFERWGGEFAPPHSYRSCSVAAFGTHDMPSLARWWHGGDIDARHAAGALDDAQRAWEHGIRSGERAALCRLLQQLQLLPAGVSADAPPRQLDEDLRLAVYAALAGSSSDLLTVPLDDALALDTQQNMPGTTCEQPNWRSCIPCQVELLAQQPRLQRLVQVVTPLR